ncbi:hypothetical protein PoB_004942800 [Plakobranchus ocellatus]|uniref:Galectin n=1 Tax=Plakobranchus ocellatus TaxID=259542 RepID=A0AAV4BUQ5_9GAST|nr:hypothetical protein PoB_004942800 [Plakobranchus ocellatus]
MLGLGKPNISPQLDTRFIESNNLFQVIHSRCGPFHRGDLIRNNRFRSQKLVTLIWILYHMIVQPSHCISESSQFVKLETLKFVCAVDLLPLTLSPGGSKYLECARECKRQPDCTAFVFTPYDVSLQPAGVKLGTCLWCPANNISDVDHTVAQLDSEIWQHVLGYVMQPQNRIELEIPGALSIGRYLTVYGRVPDPAPKRFCVTIHPYNRLQKEDWAVRISPRFNYLGHKKELFINGRINSEYVDNNTYKGKSFTFYKGENFEIAILATTSGFAVFINGVYIKTVQATGYMAGDIGFIELRYVEVFRVAY